MLGSSNFIEIHLPKP